MIEPDVVAELDRYGFDDVPREIIRRARDEIVALRQALAEEADRSQEFADHIRAQALEEAARVCEQEPSDKFTNCAAAIRALKDQK